MKSWAKFVLALTAGLVVGYAMHAAPNAGVGVAAAATNAPSTMMPMPMGSGMQMAPGMQAGRMHDCHGMQQMMQQAKSPADKALMQAMMSMHGSMKNMQMTGNADHDFLVMMIPHHQSAVEMARVELQYGKDAKVRTLAQDIIAAQQKEITEMQGWLKSGTP
jgi:uncharacterized protein (DUF305 family)